MLKSPAEQLAELLGVPGSLLETLDRRCGRTNACESVVRENREAVAAALESLNAVGTSGPALEMCLREKVRTDEQELLRFLGESGGDGTFDRAATLARRIASVPKGFFLKRDFASRVLAERPPERILRYVNAASVTELLRRFDVLEVFAALRFTETDAWMHETFRTAYAALTPRDFEERDTEVRALGPTWKDAATQFIAHKHHNVSHLKEFGVIFINPIAEGTPGAFLRDFALLFHYFHEIDFYSKLFRRAAKAGNFAERLASLLRGDVPEAASVEPGGWLIVQRYLAKDNPRDARLSVPHVNPESLHWRRAERDLTLSSVPGFPGTFRFWNNLDWVGSRFPGTADTVSFDLEDNAMSLVSAAAGTPVPMNYHQREALWTKFFSAYAGGEERMEELLIENLERGVVQF
jgi:hypothetical protein